MLDFDRKKNTEAFVRLICAHIRDPKARRDAEQEYEDHIEDAVYHAILGGMSEEEAFHQACRTLGPPENYMDLLADVHEKEELPPELKRENRKRNVLRLAAGIFLAGAVSGAAALWGIFVLQVIALGVLVWAALWLGRYLIAFVKRVRALCRLRKAASDGGYAVRTNATVFTSLFVPAAVPSVTLENDERVYKVRFVAALKKNCVLRFIGRNMYIPAVTRGGMMLLNHRNPFNGIGLFPKLAHRVLYMFHTDTAEFAGAVRMLPVLERRFDSKSKVTEEVLIFNPAPMQVLYRLKNSDLSILGGETVDGVQLHDIVSFCSRITR